MTARLLLLVLVVGFLAAVPLRGEGRGHYRVQLVVSAPDNIRGETTSYLARELRRVGDIDVIEDDPYFVIQVLAVANADRVYTFSVVVLGMAPERRESDPPRPQDAMLSHFVLGPTTDDLEDICRKIAAEIDGSVFEPIRRVPHYDGQGRLIE